jgi:hypothetical protein
VAQAAPGLDRTTAFSFASPGSAVVDQGQAGALLLWEESQGEKEYFLLERRTTDGAVRQYDSGVAGDGVCVWRVQRTMGFAAHLGAPAVTVGGSGVWTPGMQTPVLTWSNGTSTNRTLAFSLAADGAILVAWGDELSHLSISRHLRLFHRGNGISPVDSGLPLQGIFFGITTDGEPGVEPLQRPRRAGR